MNFLYIWGPQSPMGDIYHRSADRTGALIRCLVCRQKVFGYASKAWVIDKETAWHIDPTNDMPFFHDVACCVRR